VKIAGGIIGVVLFVAAVLYVGLYFGGNGGSPNLTQGTIVNVAFPVNGRGGALQTQEGTVVQFNRIVPQTFQIGVPVKIVTKGGTITAIDLVITGGRTIDNIASPPGGPPAPAAPGAPK
jgi:hypothetical protein